MNAVTAQTAVSQLATTVAALQQTAKDNYDSTQHGLGWLADGALDLVGMSHVPQTQAQVGAIQQYSGTVGRLQAMVDSGECVTKDVTFTDVLNQTAKDLGQVAGYVYQSTTDYVVTGTIDATAATVKAGVNAAASGAARFAWGILPWWVIAGGLGFGAWLVLPHIKRLRGA